MTSDRTVAMTASAAADNIIKSFEACRLAAYMPTPQDVPTIGWGTTRYADGKPVKMGDTCTQARADKLLSDGVAVVAARVDAMLHGAKTSQAQFDALVSLAYNIGVRGLGGSTLLQKHIAGKYDEAAKAFASWRFQAGKPLNGLIRRRAAEALLYRGAE